MAKKVTNPKGTPQNLTPFNKMSPEKAKEIRDKGNKTYIENCKKRRELKEELLLLLQDEETQKKLSVALINRAMTFDNVGNKAFEIIRDTIGEKPTDKQEVKIVDTDWFVE